jgi:hypothetical protein
MSQLIKETKYQHSRSVDELSDRLIKTIILEYLRSYNSSTFFLFIEPVILFTKKFGAIGLFIRIIAFKFLVELPYQNVSVSFKSKFCDSLSPHYSQLPLITDSPDIETGCYVCVAASNCSLYIYQIILISYIL